MVIPTVASSWEKRGLDPLHTTQSPLVLSEGCVPIHKGDGTGWDVSGGGGPMGKGPGPFVWLTWRRAASGVPGTSL